MTDLEICVDGLVSDRIRDMNAMVEATRQELERRYHADTEDLTMRTLKAAQINEDEYFGQIPCVIVFMTLTAKRPGY